MCGIYVYVSKELRCNCSKKREYLHSPLIFNACINKKGKHGSDVYLKPDMEHEILFYLWLIQTTQLYCCISTVCGTIIQECLMFERVTCTVGFHET